MTLFLRQSTAVVISFGPALDKTDGVTEETGLVSALDHATTGIKLSKNGGALTIRHATVTATTYDAYGMYRVTLDTTDTNTLGTLRMAFNEAATCLPVWQDFMVLPANVYDSLVGGSDVLDVSMIQILGTAVATPATAGILDVNVKNIDNDAASASGTVTFPNATLASTTNITAGTITTVTNLTNAPTNGDLTATMKASVTAAVPTAAANADAVWDEARAGHVAAGSTGQIAQYVADIYEVGDGSGGIWVGGGSVSNIVGGVWDEALAGHATAGSAGKKLSDISTGTPLGAADIRAAIGLASANLDTQLDSIPTAAENAAANPALSAAGVRAAVGLASANLDTQLGAIDDLIDTEVAAIKTVVDGIDTKMGMPNITLADDIGAPAGASLAADIAAIHAKTVNLPAAPASTTNITQATGIDITKILGTAISTPATAGILDVNIVNIGGSAADLGATPGMLDVRLAEVSLGGGIQLRSNLGLATADLDTQLAALPTAAEIADANWDEALSGHLTAGTTGKALSDAGAAGTPLDAAGVRAAVGLASANLDTQLTAIDDLIDTEVAAIKTVVDGIDTKMGMPNITLADDIGAPVVSLGADVQAVKVVVDTIAGYLDTEIAAIKAKTDNLPASPSSLDAAGVRTAIGMASANLDTQLGNTYNRIGAPVFGNISGDIAANYAILTNIEDSVGVGVSADVAAIKAKTDNLPADPASSTNVTAVYSRVGAPAGASVSADIAAVKAETATINTATGAAAIRAAVGLASANLDTQLAAIDDLLDTEIGAIKAKTDLIPASPAAVGSAMTLADEAITDAKIAELAFQGKHFDTDVEISAVTGAVGSVTAGVTVTTNNDKTGYTLTSGERNTLADAIFDRADGAVSGKTLREALSVILGVLSGKVSGAGTTTITFRHINDTKDVIVATVDAAGNRTAVTVTP